MQTTFQSDITQKRLAFIGGGNMAQAIVQGLLKQGYPASHIYVCDRNLAKRKKLAQLGIKVTDAIPQAALASDVIILAVKPQAMAEACSQLTPLDLQQHWIISIAAGISIKKLTALLPSATQFVRAMPNTPALLSVGMTGLYAEQQVSPAFKAYAESLLASVGKTCWVKTEADINMVTAASGSSPAYFFLFMECMQKVLVEMGVDSTLARTLIQQSALGAAQMVIQNPDSELATLRQQVTSKGGTTAAALQVFNDYQLEKIVQQAMSAAIKRAEQMEQLF